MNRVSVLISFVVQVLESMYYEKSTAADAHHTRVLRDSAWHDGGALRAVDEVQSYILKNT